MGLIKAVTSAIGGTFAEQWQEAIEADNMGQTTVCTGGVRVRYDDKRNQNVQGTADVISNGSVIHVNPMQFMLLTDGGRIVDYTADEGYYRVDNSAQPSLFNGQFGDVLKDAWERFKFGGGTPQKQKVYFINLQEIKGIKFGTANAVNYFDNFYNAELFLRAFGNYSIEVTNPLLFFKQALPRNQERVDINDINEQYLSEFVGALQASMNQMSVDGVRVSQVASRSVELSKYMADVLDDSWNQDRGFQVKAVGIQSISYDDESKKIISIRSQGAMLQDATIREGYVQGSIARGVEAAGSNTAGAGAAMMGVGLGMNAGGGFMGQASSTNFQQMQMQQQQQAAQQAAQGGGAAAATGPVSGDQFYCSNCGHKNQGGKFCVECGTARPAAAAPAKCTNCGFTPEGAKPKFCPECGTAF